jgi:signal transduction histidine kinase
VQVAVDVLGRYGVRKETVAPFVYRQYLRWQPDTPPPLWGATKSFWTTQAIVVSLISGFLILAAYHGVAAFGPKEVRFLDLTWPLEGWGMLIAHFLIWPLVGVSCVASAKAEQDSAAREATLLGLPPWNDFSAQWSPSLIELERQAASQQFRLITVWSDAGTMRFVCVGAVVFSSLWVMWPGAILEWGRFVAACYGVIAGLAALGKFGREQSARASSNWVAMHGVVFGMVVVAVVAACYYGFTTGFYKGTILWTLFMALLMLPAFFGERSLYRRQQQVAQQVQRAEQARQLADARLHALKAQIEPHFVFNTIAHLRSLIATEPKNAERMADELSDFLRASLQALREDRTTVEAEMLLCRSYLEIARLRFGERLVTEIEVAAAAEAIEIPPLMLLTLLENAIQHGVEPKEGPSRVVVSAAVAETGAAKVLELTVTDDGVGFGTNAIGGTGVGLANVRERLASTYGDAASLTLTANQPSGVCAQIRIPLTIVKS